MSRHRCNQSINQSCLLQYYLGLLIRIRAPATLIDLGSEMEGIHKQEEEKTTNRKYSLCSVTCFQVYNLLPCPQRATGEIPSGRSAQSRQTNLDFIFIFLTPVLFTSIYIYFFKSRQINQIITNRQFFFFQLNFEL